MTPAAQVFTRAGDREPSGSYRHGRADTLLPEPGTGEGALLLPILLNKHFCDVTVCASSGFHFASVLRVGKSVCMHIHLTPHRKAIEKGNRVFSRNIYLEADVEV